MLLPRRRPRRVVQVWSDRKHAALKLHIDPGCGAFLIFIH
jgi:hypothetical protein